MEDSLPESPEVVAGIPIPGVPKDFGIPHDPAIPDIYAEGVALFMNYSSVTLVFNRNYGTPPEAQPVATIRMSPQQLYLVSLVLRKHFQRFSEQIGAPVIPSEVREALGIPEEW